MSSQISLQHDQATQRRVRPHAAAPVPAAPAPLPLRWWRELPLRAAGFPAAGVLRLAAPAAAHAADRLLDPASCTAAALDEYRRTFDDAAARTDAALCEIAAEPRFREAVAWQNRRLLDTAVEPFLRRLAAGGARTAKLREYELVIASYWQRYCVKNESIGFFGPVGWARLDPGRPATTVRAGPALVDRSGVYFENWAIERLAEALAADPGAREWLAPRRLPYVRVEGNRLRLPARAPMEIPALLAALLLRCDGATPARELAAAVGTALEEVLAALEELARRRWIAWTLEVPAATHPEHELRRLLQQLPHVPLREEGLARLGRLDEARARLEAGAGDPARVEAGLVALEEAFVEATGASAHRHAGRTYGARTTVYLDCHRDVELTLGGDFADALEPLALVVRSAYWVTHRLRERLDAQFRDVYAELAAGDRSVPLSSFWFECLPILHDAAGPVLATVVAEFHERWRRILSVPAEVSRTRYSTAEVAGEVLRQFAVPDCGWEGARYCSPDVMIAAPSADAIRAGSFEIVLGDFHPAVNAARSQLFVEQHPAPETLRREVDLDFERPRLLPVLPKENPPRLTGRTQPALIREVDYLVALFHQPVNPRRPRLLLSADVDVVDADGRLVVAVGRGETFDVMDVFAEAALGLLLERFSLVGLEPHTPRVNLDRLVVAREAWHVPAAELAFSFEKDEPARYLAARRWWRELDLPRHVFVSSPVELKPFYVDVDSPLYVNLLARTVRRAAAIDDAAQIGLSEMLPTLEQAWLVDREDHGYTSELRLVAVAGRP